MVAFMGIMISLSSAIYVVESFIPFPLPIGRWGFSNSVVLFLATTSLKAPLTVAFGKSIIGSLFTGRFMGPGFIMGLAGSVSAALIERLLFKLGFGYLGTSIAGAALNNIVQMGVGALLIKSTYIFSLLPLFLLIGTISAVGNVYLAKTYEKFWRGVK